MKKERKKRMRHLKDDLGRLVPLMALQTATMQIFRRPNIIYIQKYMICVFISVNKRLAEKMLLIFRTYSMLFFG